MPKVIASAPNAGGRHQRGRRVGPTLAEINVIPLVDVMLVLLIIFMVAAPMLQRGVEVSSAGRVARARHRERADLRRRTACRSGRTVECSWARNRFVSRSLRRAGASVDGQPNRQAGLPSHRRPAERPASDGRVRRAQGGRRARRRDCDGRAETVSIDDRNRHRHHRRAIAPVRRAADDGALVGGRTCRRCWRVAAALRNQRRRGRHSSR